VREIKLAKFKKINLLFLVCSVIAAQSHITIYNQNKAFVQEQRTLKLDKTGLSLVQLDRIPNNADAASIVIRGDEVKLHSMKYTYNPVSIHSMLDAHVGAEIELIKYGENGNITFSTMGKLISFNTVPVFEMDGKIAVDPPYHYLFSEIPEGISEFPIVYCQLHSQSKNPEYQISYLSSGFNWEAEYSLILSSGDMGVISGFYAITNSTNLEYKDLELSLVSGSVQFQHESNRYRKSQSPPPPPRATAAFIPMTEPSPEVSESEEYVVYHIPEKLTLSPDSEIRYKFIEEKKIRIDQFYHINHSLRRIRRNSPPKTKGVPVHTRYEFEAGAVGNFQLPAGSYKVYSKKKDILTFIGSARADIAEKETKIKLETGKAQKILALFTVETFRLNNDSGKAVLTADFTNLKDEKVTVEWIENFSDGGWNITKADLKYNNLDAFNVKFSVDIKANASKKVSFTANWEKN